MKWLPLSLLFFIFLVTDIYAKGLTVTVLYESLCPDSVTFLKDQFYPAYSTALKNRITVELVPYGKANATKENGKWTFECQHKEKECYGNKVHACAIDIAPNHPSTEFVVCAMKSGDASDNDNLKQCAGDHNITWTSIEECLNSGKGDELLAKNGDRTNALRPKIPFIPTVVFNNAYKDVLQNLAMQDFLDLSELLIEESNTSSSNKISGISLVALVVNLLIFFKILV